jgi:hypothetical protein
LPTLEEKREQFGAFYLIAHPIKANVLPINDEMANYSLDNFEDNMPYAFKIAGEMSEIQSQTLKPLRNLGEKLEDLVDYLQFQAQKIDLMMSYILQQQDDVEYQAKATKFGGGGVIIEHSNADDKISVPRIGDKRAIKLFLESESAAIYCFAEVIDIEQTEASCLASYVYTHIREQDQELLVRASLHLQTAALRKQNRKNAAPIDN